MLLSGQYHLGIKTEYGVFSLLHLGICECYLNADYQPSLAVGFSSEQNES
jgi:hypothetical protein